MKIPKHRKQTTRYARKREAVLEAAAALFNDQGLKGVTLADVAVRVGLSTTSVTYYFRRKELLAAACLLRSIEVIDAIAEAAEQEPTPEARLTFFVLRYVRLLGDIVERKQPELINFQDMRALTGPGAAGVFEAYEDLFRRVRRLLRGASDVNLSRADENARAYLVLALAIDAQTWISRYDPDDYDRTGRCIVDVLLRGLRGSGSRWAPAELPVPVAGAEADPASEARDAFLQAATELVNEQGYHGASVEKISARLNVTKGAFYHHNDSKDDLLVSCFDRSFFVVRRAQRAAAASRGNGWDRVSAAADCLVRHQLSDRGPLLRYRALNAVPQAARLDLLARKGRLSERFAGMIFDGIADRSIRAVDPYVAAQLVDAMINAAANLKRWVPGTTPGDASAVFARRLFDGLVACSPLSSAAR